MNVSVVICTFNGELFLEAQLQSIAQQTRVPEEVLVFDDRSTDRTVEIARAVFSRTGLNGMVTINATRLGVEQNFSNAMCQAHGDVIFFCDQDDVWHPTKAAQMVAPFEADPTVALVYSDALIVGPDLTSSGQTLFHRNAKKDLENGDRRDIGKLLRHGHAPGIKASASAFSSWMRDLAGPLPDDVAHDTWIAYFGYALGKVVALDEPLYYYRRHNKTCGSSSTNTLFVELQSRSAVDLGTLLGTKGVFAARVYARCCQIENDAPDRIRGWKRFQELKLAAYEAARTLKVRENILHTQTWQQRLLKTITALCTGEYVAIKPSHQRLKLALQDIGFTKTGLLRRFGYK